MRKNLRRVVSILLVFQLALTGMSAAAYGQTSDVISSPNDPLKMMVDTTPELMTVGEIIQSVAPAGVSGGAISTVDTELQPSDYDDIRNVQQIVEDAIDNFSAVEGTTAEIDSLLLHDVLKKQQELVEQSKTDRFIVKYTKNGENSFKEKIADQLKDSIEIEELIPKEFKTTDKDKNSTLVESVGEFLEDTFGVFNQEDNKTELILLDEGVNPSDFADTLRAIGVEDEIEYIQPDFQMSLNSLGGESFEDTNIQPDNGVSTGSQSDGSNKSTGEAINTSKPEMPDKIISDGAITDNSVKPSIDKDEATGEAIKELPIDETPGDRVVVAVIDTGLDITHPDLQKYIYVNSNEIDGNGIDDDGNGYVDDVSGWNFADHSAAVYDEVLGLDQAHGTHIAGIIAGLSNADDNLAQNENLSILPLKVFSNGTAYTSDIIAAIDYAERMGAKIVNCSFGSTNSNQALKETIENSGMLFVCSAGNARVNLDISPVYPACFDLNNVISVTSSNADGGLSYFSNYSSNLVDVAALGRDISSTLPNGEYGLQTGTSMSTALVSGIVAEVSSYDSSLNSYGLKARILKTSDKLSNLQEVIKDGRQINLSNAIEDREQTDILSNTPESDFDVLGYSPTQAELYQLYRNDEVVQVSAGLGYSLVVKDNGTVWSWGANESSECGNGLAGYSEVLTQVIGLTNVISVDTGYDHNLALKSDGTVWSWGSNESGQVGDGTYSTRIIPVQVSGLNDIAYIAAGCSFSIAMGSDGTIWTWGNNDYGQLGDGTMTTTTIPAKVSGLSDAISISAGFGHSLAMKADGTVWAWGCNWYGQLGDGTTIIRTEPTQVSGLSNAVSISAGFMHSLAVKSGGIICTWGYNQSGQLGDGTMTTRKTPVQVSGLSGAISISAGYGHSLAMKADGTVWAWGGNRDGELGITTTYYSTTPVQVSGLNDVSSVSAGEFHNLALKIDGTVWAWGDNDFGQLGDGTSVTIKTPIKVDNLTNVTSVDTGDYHSLLSMSDGTVWAWGDNNYGQLGNGTTTDSSIPVQVSGLDSVSYIVSGRHHCLAVKSDGTIWAWGNNEYSQLGNGTTTDSSIPVQVSGLSGVTNVVAGEIHNIALKSDGTIWVWGDNSYGQLGDNSILRSSPPVQVSGIADIISIAAGSDHSLAVKSDGTVWAWGSNEYGQLGDGTRINRRTPMQVIGLTDVVSVAAGYFYSVAIKSDGTVWAWGNNKYGQLGDETKTYESIPVQVSGLTDVVSVEGGEFFNLAMKKDGTVWAWGSNEYGQLGDGTLTDNLTPVQVSNLSSVVSLAAGRNHCLAQKSNGTACGWGSDVYGQIGQSRILNAFIPIQCQTYNGLLSFESTNYMVEIPTSSSQITTVSAVGTDSYGNSIPYSEIRYKLAGSYAGISINGTTGTITIEPTAQAGLVQVMATYQNLTCSTTLTLTVAPVTDKTFTCTLGKDIYMPFRINDFSNLNNKVFTLKYNASDLDVIDLISQTKDLETTTGIAAGGSVEILSLAPGEITFKINKSIPESKTWSGEINVFKFKAKITGQTSISTDYN